jgi:microcystin-dependent protein
MSTIFPENPEVNDESNGYRWNGVAWQIIGIDLTQEYPVITNGTISDSAVPATVARTESPEFTGIVVLPQNTSIGDISHTEIMSLSGASGSIQAQIHSKANIDSQTFTGTVALPSTTSIGDVSSAEISYLHGVSGSIQVQIDGKTTASYVDTAISNALSGVVDSAPSTLDTLNELAAALGDDPNFATTITDLIANKITSVPGIINQFAGSGSAAPTGWLFCDGQEVLITTYQNLYNALTSNGTTFPYGANTNGSGGAGSTHFRIPNFKGRVPVGKDSAQTEFDILGETGGSKTSTAPHNHSISHDHGSFNATSGTESADHGHGFDLNIVHSDGTVVTGEILNVGIFFGTGRSRYLDGTAGRNAAHTHTTAIDVPNLTGTSGAASSAATSGNLQPYITVNYIIKT